MAGQPIFKKEKIWLALIPVVGSIIVAIVAIIGPNIPPIFKKTESNPIVNELRNKAGKINDLVIYDDYNELYPMFSAGLKPKLPKELFQSANDSMQKLLGNYIKPIDTTESKVSGTLIFYVRNQRQYGQSITTIIFDDQGKIFAIYISSVSK